MSSCPSLNPRKEWRITWETLAHIPTLRLYLFDPNFDPSVRCQNLTTSLLFSQSLLLVSWIDSHQSAQVSLRVPIPKVLIDPDSPLDCRLKDDHIEIKLQLVLPVDHPVVADLRGVLGSGGGQDLLVPLSLDSDLKNLSSSGVNFFCKTCSTRITRQPLRRFVEMPSVNWREAADNWFGACCCSFGGISEKLASHYIRTYNCPEGTCLLDDASAVVCKDDLEGYTFQQCFDGNSDCSYKVDVEPKINVIEGTEETCGNASKVASDFCTISPADMASLKLNHCSVDFEKTSQENTGGLSSEDRCHCCVDETKPMLAWSVPANVEQSSKNSEPEKIQKWLHDCSLGSGFMTRTSNLSDDIEWVELLCRHCSSTLGSYPSSKTANVPVDGGIRLFKCYVSTCIPVCDPQDVFRKHSLQRLFAALLLEGAKDELSYRTVIKDLRTKSPMLQIVLLSSEAWCSTGHCLEDADVKPISETDLQPVVKVLFADCSTATEASLRMIKDWSTRTHTEEVYMMRRQIDELIKCLKSAGRALPDSCSSLQGMSLSYLER